MSKTTTSDGLITDADVKNFKADVDQGNFKLRVDEMVAQEPELAIYISDRYSKTLDSLQEAGVNGRRLAALHKHISLLVWGSAILMQKAHRREWDQFLPSEEMIQPPPDAEKQSPPDHECEAEDVCAGLMVTLYVDQLRLLCPLRDDASLRALMQRYAESIAHQMVSSGIVKAASLFNTHEGVI